MPTYSRRRVSGLRREEVAFLAGVSTSYYTRIEQGTAGAVSGSVLTALADALRLDQDDRAHMARLARVTLCWPAAVPQVLLPSISAAMSHINDDTPVAVLGRGMRVLAWNRLAQQVFAPHRDFDEPSSHPGVNWVEVLLLDLPSRQLFADWPLVVEDAVGRLRVDAARRPDDLSIRELVESLTRLSPEFRSAWERHPTRASVGRHRA